MNKEGYKDPTPEKAIRKVTQYESLCRKYNVKKGDKVKIVVEVQDDLFAKTPRIRKKETIVVSMTARFITLQLSAGYCTCMTWDEFQKARC